MNIWRMTKWHNFYNSRPCRSGLRVDFEKNVHPEVKRAIKEFIVWLRSEYVFPKRVRIYIKSTERIKARDGDMVYGTLFQPFDRNDEPYAKIATGDYLDLVQAYGVDDALAKILGTIAHATRLHRQKHVGSDPLRRISGIAAIFHLYGNEPHGRDGRVWI